MSKHPDQKLCGRMLFFCHSNMLIANYIRHNVDPVVEKRKWSGRWDVGKFVATGLCIFRAHPIQSYERDGLVSIVGKQDPGSMQGVRLPGALQGRQADLQNDLFPCTVLTDYFIIQCLFYLLGYPEDCFCIHWWHCKWNNCLIGVTCLYL